MHKVSGACRVLVNAPVTRSAARAEPALPFPEMLARTACALALTSVLGCTHGSGTGGVKQPPPPGGPDVAFDIYDGGIHNYFYRQGPIAAHMLVSSGVTPRLLVAFPAGNTGIGVWFEKVAKVTKFDVESGLVGVQRPDGMRGVQADLTAETSRLEVRSAVLGSIRTLRDFVYTSTQPPETVHKTTVGPPVVMRRTTADGTHHVELSIEPMAGTTATLEGGKLVLTAGPDRSIHVRVVGLADDEPLTPIPMDQLLTAAPPESSKRDLQALAFLSYKEKLLAGSWRFLTYFGRDTLLSTRLLMPALKPDVIEAALGAVIDRLAPDGDVAHEEDIGDFATLHHKKQAIRPADLRQPIHDYKMVDDDFLLAPVLATYVLDTEAGRSRAAQLMSRKTPSGEPFTKALEHNLELVIQRSTPFAEKPSPANLVAIKDGLPVGQWRDSEQGLGTGRFAFDVNVALVPAALEAAARLYESPLLGAKIEAAANARKLAKAWQAAESMFRVELPRETAVAKVTEYAAAQGIDGTAAAASINAPVVFHALSLDAAGKPIPVMHTDDGFVLMFGSPSAEYLTQVAGRLTRPFPAGLLTPVGIVVANAVFVSDAKIRDLFSRDAYHGAVVWSWQQALLAAGLQRQLARTDLPAPTRAALEAAQKTLWDVIEANAAQRTGELWTWTTTSKQIVFAPFGQDASHADESNAAQLWSTVYLGVHRPAAAAKKGTR